MFCWKKSFWWSHYTSMVRDLTVETLATRAKQNESAIKNEDVSSKELAEELHNPIIKNFQKRKVLSPFMKNIWGADLADMQLISRFDKEICFLLCVIDIFSKYAWVIPLKDIIITKDFQKLPKTFKNF